MKTIAIGENAMKEASKIFIIFFKNIGFGVFYTVEQVFGCRNILCDLVFQRYRKARILLILVVNIADFVVINQANTCHNASAYGRPFMLSFLI